MSDTSPFLHSQKLMRCQVANRYQFPFVPRGSGFTFSAFPTLAGTVVIDPKRMDRIIELNEKVITITIKAADKKSVLFKI